MANRINHLRINRSIGFTIVEAMVVVAVLAILLGVGAPSMTRMGVNQRLKAAGHDIASSMSLARSEALATRKETRLLLDLEQRAFRVEPDPRVHALPKQIELKLFTAQSDLLSDKVGAIRFFPDGGSNGGRVTLAAGERKYNVDIDWLTGRVAILD